MMLADQRRFLISLSTLEKSQSESTLVCRSVVFEAGGRVRLGPSPEGSESDEVPARSFAITATAEQIWMGLSDGWSPPLVRPSPAALDLYPSRTDLASVWAELHFDLGRTSFLDEFDPSIRYRALAVVRGNALVELRSSASAKTVSVRIPLDTGEFPLHVADELAEALRR